MHGITKRYPGTLANDAVDFEVHPGSVHALVGENGAGKSTLMHIASGLVAADSGSVRIGGRELGGGGVAQAMALGLGMVHQHFMLVPTLTVAENVALGHEPRRGPFVDRAAAERHVSETARRFGLQLDPAVRTGDLGVGLQQRVEIVKVLSRGARTLILDEPTAVLTPQEVDGLFRILRGLIAAGHAVVLISHRLSEVLELADRVTVLRAGRVVASVDAGETSEVRLAELVVGHELRAAPARRSKVAGEVVLQLAGVSAASPDDAVHQVSLEVRAGEVLGIAGVEGNGQRALADAVVGLASRLSGSIHLDGVDVTRFGVARRRRAGVAYVPADRHAEAVVAGMSLEENLALGHPEVLGRWIRPSGVRSRAMALLQAFDVRPPTPNLEAAALSGGNQQRLVLAREMETTPRLLVLAHPTRGVDVRGIEFVHARVLAARDAGCAVLLLSADLQEILTLSDRIAVLFAGRIAGTVAAREADARQLGLWMTGAEESK